MNFVGKFDAKLHVDGSGAHPDAHHHHHLDSVTPHAPSDAIIVADADLLFKGDFKRSGVDLILSRDDHELVVQNYFKGEKRAALASPDGAHLTGDIVNALAGDVEYAQADGSAGAGKVIGHVTKLTGTATAIRNGVSIILNQGDNVEKGDVVQSGSGSTLGVTFIDGSVFGLSSNARMVLNEMIYDPNGSNNSTLISLVAGTISFVAGQTAKHGDMKIDTPVATMGIRGTAVLVEIDFDVPGQNGAPEAKFQVLVEPDGTTGSYILFDKNTLAPIAVVDKAGQQVNISDGNVSFSDSPLSPELQKLINDVFTLKFTDNTNPHTLTHFTDTLTPPQMFAPIKLADGATATPVVLFVSPINLISPTSSLGPSGPTNIVPHINQPPHIAAVGSSLTALPDTVGNSVIDTASGKISFTDINPGDLPTAKSTFESFTYQNAQHLDVTATLNAQQLADIQALEVPLVVVQTPGNNNNGTATWTYNIPNTAVEFLSAGETLTLTYMAEVDSNYAQGNLASFIPFTITVTGTNDAPVITSSVPKIAFTGGINTPGGHLTAKVPTSGTFSFVDVNLDDTHTVATKLASAVLSGVAPGTSVPPGPLQIFETALTAKIAADSTGTGNGTIDWSLANLPVYLADFIPNGDTLTLTYAVTVTDSQYATSTQDITVTIAGNDTPAVVWIDTTPPPPSGALWSDASNWETGTVPTATDDVIIITDQLIGLTPSYPVTIDAPAFAHSLTMNDYGTPFTNSPTLINKNTLTVGAGGISLSADAILENFGLLKLLDGGDFKDQSTIKNLGPAIIEVAGGTLNVLVDIANSGKVAIDPNATLTLNGAGIDGGTVTNNGTVDLTGNAVLKNGTVGNSGPINVSGTGNALINESINNGLILVVDPDGDIALPVTFKSEATFPEASGNGTITVADPGITSGTIAVATAGTLTLNGATITGGSITNNGTIEVAGDSAVDNASMSGGQVTVDADTTLTLNNVAWSKAAITNLGTIEIAGNSDIINDMLSNAQLTVDKGVTLSLDGTTVTGGGITDTGTVKVDSGDTLKLSDVALSGGAISNLGTIEISGTGSIDNDVFGNNQLTIDSGVTLTLDGTTITGGTVSDNGTVKVDASDTLKLNGVALSGGAISNLGTIEISGTGSIDNDVFGNHQLTIDSGAMLTLDGTTITGGAITDNGTVKVDASDTLKLNGVALSGGAISNLGTIEISGTGSIDNDAFGNNQLTIDSGVTLTLDGTTITGGTVSDNGTIHVDSGQTLTLDGASVTGGTVMDNGTIDVIGASTLAGITFNGAAGGTDTIDNAGTLALGSGGLTLGGSTAFTLALDGAGTLALHGQTIQAVTSGMTLENVDNTISGSGSIGDADLTVQNDQYGVIDATGELALNAVTTTNSGLLEATSGGTLQIEGSVSNSGLIEATGGTVVVDSTAAITGNPSVTITDGGIAEFAGGSSAQPLVLNATFSGTGTLELDHSQYYGGTITGFATGDTIDLTDLTYSSSETDVWNSATDTLTIYNGTHSSSLIFSGSYNQNSFALTSDANGDTEVVSSPATAALTGLDSASNAVIGYTVTASLTDANASNVTYQWLDNGVAIANATGASYTPTANDLGNVLDVVVGFTDGDIAEHVTAIAGTAAGPPAVSFNPADFIPADLTFNGNNYASGPLATRQVGNGTNDGVTLAGWVDWNGQSNSGNHGQVLFYNGSTSDAGFGVLGNVTANGLDLKILVGGVTEDDTGVTLSAGQWYDVALTHVNGGFTLYVDGVAEHTFQAGANTMPGPAHYPDSMLIGGDASGEGFAGSIGEVSVWNTALTQSQVQALESTSLSGGETGLAAYYPLSDGSGTTAADLVNGAGNLSLSGNPSWVTNSVTTNANTALTLNGLTVTEADAGSHPISVTLDASHGTLSLVNAAGVTESGTGLGSSPLILTGTLDAIDAALTGGVNYTPTTGYYGTDTLSVTAESGAINSNTATVNVNVDPEAPPPAMSLTTIDDPGATATYAYGINNAGQIVGEATANPNNEVGWEYSAGNFTAIGVVGDQDNGARAINNLGEVVGSDSPVRSTPRYGLVDINGTDTQINLPPGVSSGANGVNDAGVVVGQSYLHAVGDVIPVYTGYIDDNGSVTYLNAPGTLTANGYTAANGINNAGQVVGDYETTYGSNDQGFLYNGSTYTTISDPFGVNGTVAESINDNGVIVGFFTDASNKQHGFIDNGGVFTTVDNPLGVNGTSLNGINNAGEVVGNYVGANNVTHGFVASPTVTIIVQTHNGLDFQHHNVLAEMGAGTIQSGGSSTSFTIVDTADNLEFVLDGNNFTYGGSSESGITVTGGTLTSFHEFMAGPNPAALADFTGFLVNAATSISDVQQAAASGDHSVINALTSTFAYNFIGGSGPDSFGSAGHADTLGGTGVDVFDGGGAPSGSHDTLTGGAGSTFVFQQGYGALTITNFDQASGTFDANENDQIQLNGLTAPTAQNVSYANGDAILDFGNGDVITLLHVTQTEYEALGGTEFSTGGNGGNGGGNNNGPEINNANNIVTYTGTPVVLDPSIAVSDTTGTVTSVNAWISAGAQTGDALTINGTADGTITDSDGSTIHYHFDGHAIELDQGSGSSGIPTLDDFDAALQLIEFSPGAADGARTITWAAHEGVNTSQTVTTTVDVGPTLNSFALTVSEGSSTVLTIADFDVTHSQSSDFFSMPLNSVTGGEFEVTQDGGQTWPSAPTGGFTISQIEAGDVRFTPDSSAIVPDFPITVSDGTGNVSPAIAAMVTLEITGPNAETITFTGSNGILQLDNPPSFTGTISNFTGTAANLSSSDAIDLVGFNAADTTVTSAVYNSGTGVTAVTVTDSSGDGLSTVLNFSGNDPASMFKIGSSSDGAYVFDPPAMAGPVTPAPPATSTIAATAPNQILTGHAVSDTFAFNFTGVGETTVTDFHPATDTLQFSGQLFANMDAAMNATHDDGHGNTVIALDAHDAITLNGILKAQLHASDFHFV